MKVCEHCEKEIPADRARKAQTRFCSESCRRKAEHRRGWDGGRIKAYFAKNKEIIDATARAWRVANPEKTKAQRERHREARIAATKNWKTRNQERVRELRSLSQKRNPEARRRRSKKWREANPERARFHSRNYDARKIEAMPKWLSPEQHLEIESIYRNAGDLQRSTGIPHDVDHIIPLQGKTVCGLHVPWNLQVLAHVDNVTKGNRLVEIPADRPVAHPEQFLDQANELRGRSQSGAAA